MGCHSTGDLVQESVCCHHGTASICTIHGKAHPTAGATTCSTATRQIKWQTRELMLSFSRFPSRSSLFGGIQRVKISPVGSINRVEIHIRFRFIEDHDLSRTGVARSVDSAPIRPIIIKDRIKPSLSSVGSVHFLTRARRPPISDLLERIHRTVCSCLRRPYRCGTGLAAPPRDARDRVVLTLR